MAALNAKGPGQRKMPPTLLDSAAMATPARPVPLSTLLDGCATAVQAVRAGRSLTDVLAAVEPTLRPGVQALAFDVMRKLGAAAEVGRMLAPKRPAPWVDALLCSALALLWPAEAPAYPAHTLVDQAVAAARRRVPAAAGFVNAVLRRFVRERDTLVAAALRRPVARWNHPAWWIEQLRADWPAQWQALLAAADHHPPMTLRVNLRRISTDAYVQRLAAAGLGAAVPADPAIGGQAVVLERPCPVLALPGFTEGEVSVQDAAAQRAAPLLLAGGLAPGARVLDACAAPGGKAAHLLERADLDLLALDRDADRLERARAPCSACSCAPSCAPATPATRATGGTGAPSTRSCSTRPAALPGSCGAIPTSAGCAAPATCSRWPRSRHACSTRCVAAVEVRWASALRNMFGLPLRRSAPDRRIFATQHRSRRKAAAGIAGAPAAAAGQLRRSRGPVR